jgi:hypothetical protein
MVAETVVAAKAVEVEWGAVAMDLVEAGPRFVQAVATAEHGVDLQANYCAKKTHRQQSMQLSLPKPASQRLLKKF